MLTASDPHPGTEFLASTDERFRPVHLATGPDGALYVADMYRGLIQHGAYVTPYLREQTMNRKLVLPVNRGRIWRIVPENWQPRKPENYPQASSNELVAVPIESRRLVPGYGPAAAGGTKRQTRASGTDGTGSKGR